MMRILSGLAAPVIVAAALLAAYAARGVPYAEAVEAAQPPTSFAQCKACHSVAKGGPAGVGPNLFGILGAPAGARASYAYSPAMKASKIRWDRAKLDAYLTDPKVVVPGTKMAIPGVKDAAKRKEILDYLATLK
jgi:cytochrome c